MPKLSDRLMHAWNAFTNRDPTFYRGSYNPGEMSYSYRPDRARIVRGGDRSIVTSVYNRIAIDAAAVQIRHVVTDVNNRFVDYKKSGLDECLSLSANVDQTGRAFIQDAIMSMFDEGVVAIVPVETTLNPDITGGYDIDSLRTGKIIQWYPRHVKVRLYDDRVGKYSEIICPKETVAIIENPLYAVMNEPNSTLQRLIRKLSLLDDIDEQSSAGKLDMIIQIPYALKNEARRAHAEERRKDIEMQLTGSKYGIAYTDGTEKIMQLNRPLENNLLKQIEYLTSTLYSQLGLTEEIFKGTADEKAMLNYHNRTIEPILSAITDEMKRKFLTKTARTQGQSIMFFKDPFKLVPVDNIADIADKFTRNEILSSNEVRGLIGFKPSADPKADELRNKNLNQSNEELAEDPYSMDPELTEEGMEDVYE